MLKAARAIGLPVLLGLAGCAAAPAPYAASTGEGAGYSETRLDEGRYDVTFQGDARMSEALVQQSVFYRAAELTLRDGYDAFTTLSQSVDRTDKAAEQTFQPVLSTAYEHNLKGYIISQEWQVQSVRGESHMAAARIEIRMSRGQAAPAVHVFDAREVILALSQRVKPGK